MNLPLLLHLNQVQIYKLNLKIPKCLRMDVERVSRRPCLVYAMKANKLLSLNRDACPGVKERLINQSKTDLKE